MMNPTRKETRHNLSNRTNNRKAEFVTTEPGIPEKFKYIHSFSFHKYISNMITAVNNIRKKMISKLQLWTKNVDFVAIRNQSTLWLTEAFIEGLLVNFVVWSLFGAVFNPITVLGYGIAVKQILSFYWRLRNNGTITTIP